MYLITRENKNEIFTAEKIEEVPETNLYCIRKACYISKRSPDIMIFDIYFIDGNKHKIFKIEEELKLVNKNSI